MVVSQMQGLLAAIYDLPVAHQVGDFLFTDRRLLPAELRATAADEQVLVSEEPQSAAIGVFVDESVLKRLESTNPMRRLDGGNIVDFWTALEGVSHFMYLVFNASHDRQVSLLELELQAEVDKYVASLWLLRAQGPAHFPRGLHRLLFEEAHVDPALAGERTGLYQRANGYAARFCRRLERQLAARRSGLARDMLAELRRFYRWGSAHKRHHIEACA